jgi:hypothetical protein
LKFPTMEIISAAARAIHFYGKIESLQKPA